MESKMNTWQNLGLQGNHHTLPNQFSSDSTIKSNEIASFPPSVLVMGLVQGKTSEILLPLTHRYHEMIYFGTTDDLLWSQWRLVDDIHWWTFLLFFYMTQCFSHMTHSISILANFFSPLLFVFLKWLFIHSLTPIFVQPFFNSSPICILHSHALSFNWCSFLSCHIASFCCLIVQCSSGICI